MDYVLISDLAFGLRFLAPDLFGELLEVPNETLDDARITVGFAHLFGPIDNLLILGTHVLGDEENFERAREIDLSDEDYGTFECNEGEYVLEAAEAEGYDWPFSCRAGACANCAAIIIEGEIDMDMQQILIDRRKCSTYVYRIPATDHVKLVYNAKHLDYLQNRVI